MLYPLCRVVDSACHLKPGRMGAAMMLTFSSPVLPAGPALFITEPSADESASKMRHIGHSCCVVKVCAYISPYAMVGSATRRSGFGCDLQCDAPEQ